MITMFDGYKYCTIYCDVEYRAFFDVQSYVQSILKTRKQILSLKNGWLHKLNHDSKIDRENRAVLLTSISSAWIKDTQ